MTDTKSKYNINSSLTQQWIWSNSWKQNQQYENLAVCPTSDMYVTVNFKRNYLEWEIGQKPQFELELVRK